MAPPKKLVTTYESKTEGTSSDYNQDKGFYSGFVPANSSSLEKMAFASNTIGKLGYNDARSAAGATLYVLMLGEVDKDGNPKYLPEDILDPTKLVNEKKQLSQTLLNNAGTPEGDKMADIHLCRGSLRMMDVFEKKFKEKMIHPTQYQAQQFVGTQAVTDVEPFLDMLDTFMQAGYKTFHARLKELEKDPQYKELVKKTNAAFTKVQNFGDVFRRISTVGNAVGQNALDVLNGEFSPISILQSFGNNIVINRIKDELQKNPNVDIYDLVTLEDVVHESCLPDEISDVVANLASNERGGGVNKHTLTPYQMDGIKKMQPFIDFCKRINGNVALRLGTELLATNGMLFSGASITYGPENEEGLPQIEAVDFKFPSDSEIYTALTSMEAGINAMQPPNTNVVKDFVENKLAELKMDEQNPYYKQTLKLVKEIEGNIPKDWNNITTNELLHAKQYFNKIGPKLSKIEQKAPKELFKVLATFGTDLDNAITKPINTASVYHSCGILLTNPRTSEANTPQAFSERSVVLKGAKKQLQTVVSSLPKDPTLVDIQNDLNKVIVLNNNMNLTASSVVMRRLNAAMGAMQQKIDAYVQNAVKQPNFKANPAILALKQISATTKSECKMAEASIQKETREAGPYKNPTDKERRFTEIANGLKATQQRFDGSTQKFFDMVRGLEATTKYAQILAKNPENKKAQMEYAESVLLTEKAVDAYLEHKKLNNNGSERSKTRISLANQAKEYIAQHKEAYQEARKQFENEIKIAEDADKAEREIETLARSNLETLAESNLKTYGVKGVSTEDIIREKQRIQEERQNKEKAPEKKETPAPKLEDSKSKEKDRGTAYDRLAIQSNMGMKEIRTSRGALKDGTPIAQVFARHIIEQERIAINPGYVFDKPETVLQKGPMEQCLEKVGSKAFVRAVKDLPLIQNLEKMVISPKVVEELTVPDKARPIANTLLSNESVCKAIMDNASKHKALSKERKEKTTEKSVEKVSSLKS